LAGDLQFSGSPSAAISAVLKGAKLKVLFVGEDHSAFQVWAQADIKTLTDLKGKAIGIISRGDTTEIVLRYILDKHNLPADYWSYAPLGTGTARIAALASGAYPAALIDVAEVKDMENAGKLSKLHLLMDLRNEVQMTFGGYATSDAMIANNRDVVRRVMRAMLKGLAVVKTDRESTVAALANHGSTREGAEAGYALFAESISPTGIVPPDNQQFELRVRAEMLSVAPDKIPPASAVFDSSFVEKAAAELKAENWKPRS
jgi:NitT/TauT family transport system substrate-binding protein